MSHLPQIYTDSIAKGFKSKSKLIGWVKKLWVAKVTANVCISYWVGYTHGNKISQFMWFCIYRICLNSLNIYAQLSSGVKGLNFGQNTYLCACLVYGSSEDPYKAVHLHRLVGTFTTCISNKYQILMCWTHFFLVLIKAVPFGTHSLCYIE